ncbi:MAG: ATPase F0F1 [Isosphaera sp.]|nr:ATPase F0F1 [Isosphaera sp.]
MSRDPGKDRRVDYRGLALAGTAVGEIVAPILIGVWLDGRYGWAPWGLAVGATLGFVGGIAHLIVIAWRENKKGEPGA